MSCDLPGDDGKQRDKATTTCLECQPPASQIPPRGALGGNASGMSGKWGCLFSTRDWYNWRRGQSDTQGLRRTNVSPYGNPTSPRHWHQGTRMGPVRPCARGYVSTYVCVCQSVCLSVLCCLCLCAHTCVCVLCAIFLCPLHGCVCVY